MNAQSRTTARLVAALRSATVPLDTAALAERLDLHPNGVREQLRRLEARGAVERRREHGAIGRPRDLWSLVPRMIAEADRPHTGWTMARSLARAIPPTSTRLREVEAAGLDMGLELACQVGLDPAEGPVGELDRALEALGFEPEREPTAAGMRYRLRTCPYAEAVRENPAVVCTLHRGVVQGVLACIGGTAELVAFEPRDPDVAGCIVEVRLTARDAP